MEFKKTLDIGERGVYTKNMSTNNKKPTVDAEIETANLQVALDSFWACWKEMFGEGHEGKCREDYLKIREIIENQNMHPDISDILEGK